MHLLRVHSPTSIPVDGHEVLLPTVEHSPQLLELVETHGAGHVSLQEVFWLRKKPYSLVDTVYVSDINSSSLMWQNIVV